METVKIAHAKQRIGRFLFHSGELPDSYAHVIINHHGGNTFYLTEEITMAFHEGKGVLMTEQPGITTVAMA